MTAEHSQDLASRLKLVDQPPPPTPMPPADLALRLKTSMWVRRLLPTRLVLARAIRKGRRLWEEDSGAREDALEAMAVVTGTSKGEALTGIAREHVIEQEAQKALFWQPWRRPLLDAQSERRLRETLQGSRGVVVSTCHTGPYSQVSSGLHSIGHKPYAIYGPWFFEQPSPDHWGRRLARWRKGIGAWLVPSKGSFPVVQALLARGECVLVFFDMPGHRRTRFLGKPAMLADGSARLAIASDALVLPVRARRAGRRVWLDVAAPLDPRELADVEDLHEALASLHERWILEFPAAMDDPRGIGWEEGASAHAWVPPKAGAR
jgi:lauroyl/myristoyl acyltransferase